MSAGFEWDARKNRSNLAKHGIDFADAIAMFANPTLERSDIRRDYGEERIIAIGRAINVEIVVVYAVRGANRRIISARKARRNERSIYQAHLAQSQRARPD